MTENYGGNMEECEFCKRYQNRSCRGGVKNCLLYDEEPKGRIINFNIKLELNSDALNPIIAYNETITSAEGISYKVNKIISIDQRDMSACISVRGYSKEYEAVVADIDAKDRRTLFKIIK